MTKQSAMVATWRKLLWLLLLTTKTTAHLLDLMVDLEPACSRQTFFWTGPGGAFSIRQGSEPDLLLRETFPEKNSSARLSCYTSCCLVFSNVQPFVVKAASVLFGDVAFDSNHYWFIHTERDSAAVAKVAAESLPLRIHSKFFIVTDSEVEEVYKTAPLNADLVRVEAARSSDGGETLSWVAPDLHDNIYGRRSDLRGQAIRYSSNPYDYWQMSVDPATGEIVGATGEILDHLRRQLNLSLVFVPYTDSGPWADEENVAKFYGRVIAFTYMNEIDLLADPYTYYVERINYVDFTVAFQEDVGYFMVKKEARREFLSFFDKVTYFKMSLMTVPILVLSLLYVPALGKGSPKRRGSLWFGGGGVLLTAVSHVCLALGTIWSYEDGAGRRGGGHTWSRRCFAFTLLLFGYYVYCLFEGTLSSYLTIQKIDVPFDSFEELAETDYIVSTHYGSGTYLAFKTAPEGTTLRRIYEEKMADYYEYQWHDSLSEVLPHLREGRIAMLYDQFIIERLPGFPCLYWYVRRPRFVYKMGYLVRKGSDYLPFFNLALMKLRQTGNLEKIRRKYQETVIGRSNVGNRCDPEAEGIGFASVQLPFAAVAAGVLMATLLGCLERTRGG